MWALRVVLYVVIAAVLISLAIAALDDPMLPARSIVDSLTPGHLQ
jgi:hypothetical protein